MGLACAPPHSYQVSHWVGPQAQGGLYPLLSPVPLLSLPFFLSAERRRKGRREWVGEPVKGFLQDGPLLLPLSSALLHVPQPLLSVFSSFLSPLVCTNYMVSSHVLLHCLSVPSQRQNSKTNHSVHLETSDLGRALG